MPIQGRESFNGLHLVPLFSDENENGNKKQDELVTLLSTP